MKKLILSSLVLVSAASCTRSPEFEKDKDYYRPESPYYDRNTKSGSQQVESMGQPKKKVLILNFWNDTPVRTGSLGSFASDEMKRGVSISQRMIVPKDVHTMLTTEDFVSGEKIKVSQLIREGRRLGVAVLVIGRITKVVFRQKGDEIGVFRQRQSLAAADVEIKVFDVAAGREVAAIGRSGETAATANVAIESENLESQSYRSELAKLAIRNAVTGLVPDVLKTIEKMVWQGRIAKISGNKLYINAGRTSGIIAGDILKALTPGDDVYDPSTGAYLGRSPGQLKGTLEVVDFIGADGAVAEIHTGGNFQEGDVVQLY